MVKCRNHRVVFEVVNSGGGGMVDDMEADCLSCFSVVKEMIWKAILLFCKS